MAERQGPDAEPDELDNDCGRDDFGPDLNKFEALADSLEKDLDAAKKEVDELTALARSTYALVEAYRGKVATATDPNREDYGRDETGPVRQTLSQGLSDAWDNIHTTTDKFHAVAYPILGLLDAAKG